MFKINITVDMSTALAKINGLREQVPFATALALTKTAQGVKQDMIEAERAAFKSATSFTLRSTYITPANKQTLQAVVGISKRAPWVAREALGGQRDPAIEKALAVLNIGSLYAVPTDACKRTSSGKVSRSWLRTVVIACQTVGGGIVTRKGGKKQQFFLLLEKRGRLPPGIYGRNNRQVVLLIPHVPM